MSDFFPDELIEDILSRLPVQSLLRFRCVCKTWHDLISDPSFINLHLDRSVEQNAIKFSIFCDDDDTMYCFDVKNSSCNIKSIGLIPDACSWYHIGSCDGLVFYLCKDKKTIAIVNPSTRTHMFVEQEEDISANHHTIDVFYDPISASYKLLTTAYFTPYEANVYSFRNKTWKNIGHIPNDYVIKIGEGVLLYRALHWIAVAADSSGVILALNLKDEKFLEMQLPQDDGELTKWENKLCVVCVHEETSIFVWIMKEYGNRNSWTKQFVIQTAGIKICTLSPLHMTASGEMIFHIVIEENQNNEQSSGLFVCDQENKILEEIEFGISIGDIYWHNTHVESLLDCQHVTGTRKLCQE